MEPKAIYTLEKELKQHFAREKRWKILPWMLLIFFSIWSMMLQLEKEELKKDWEIRQHNQEALQFQQEKQMSHQLLEKEEIPVDKALKVLEATCALRYQRMEIKGKTIRAVFQGEALQDAQEWIAVVKDLGVSSSLQRGEGDREWDQLEMEGKLP